MADTAIRLCHIQLKNFRCFKQYSLDIDSSYVLLEGANGVGKTSILEALYYTCYLRSFRTHSPKELISFGKEEFFVKVLLDNEQHVSHTIQIGFSHNKRLVKVDQRPINSYKDLMAHYRVVSVSESDLGLVQASPQHRRLFMDQVAILLDPTYAQQLKTYRQIVDQRNALLQHRPVNQDTYTILSAQLWDRAHVIQQERNKLLDRIAKRVNARAKKCMVNIEPIHFLYCPKRSLEQSFEAFQEKYRNLQEQEMRFGRTLFGPHLDDISIIFEGQQSRLFASRGQQKLIVMLIKMAQLELLLEAGIPGICLLDDFMTDFDPDRAEALLESLKNLGTQLIFTTPVAGGKLADQLKAMGAQITHITD